MSDETNGGFSWFVAGLGLGALIGVLYAPKSGRETREDIAAQASEKAEYLKQRSREVTDQAGVFADRAKAQAGEYVDRGRAQWDEFVDKSKGFVGEQTGKVAAAVDAGKQAYQTTTKPTEPTNQF